MEIPCPNINFQAPEIQRNPYSTYGFLLDNYPVFRISKDRVGVCKLDHVLFVLDKDSPFRVGSGAVVSPEWQERQRKMFILSENEPQHGQSKSIVSKAFVGKVINRHDKFMHMLVTQLVKKASGKPFEFFKELGYPYTATVIGTILGTADTQESHLEVIYEWVELLERDSLDQPSSDHQRAVDAAYDHLHAWYREVISARSRSPRGDLISELIAARVDGKPLTEEEIFGAIDLFLIAGFQATSQAIASSLLFLSKRGDVWNQLRSDPSRINIFVEELIRLHGPSHAVLRYATADVKIGEYTIPAGTLVSAFMAAANRDPDHFESPDEFRWDRKTRRQIGFGSGIHTCIGAALARMELKILLEVLLELTNGVSCPPYEDLDWLLTPTTRGLKSLPMTLA